MNFFEHQEQARRHTSRLVLLFTAAVLSLIALTDLLVALFLGINAPRQYPHFKDIPPQIHGYIALGIASIVLLAILYKWSTLSEGGTAVASALGGRPIPSNTRDPDERKVINIVEEMALASGTSVPIVYVLEDRAINAFAAGYGPHDAVIGITRAAMELLDRDELQGVIAHEFSHMLNGDMRLNLRLIAILFGILFIALAGDRLIRATWRSREGGPLILLGMGLMVVGYAGSFFGGMIKAAVSRQREFLADASAVQFTRNPDGIAGALQKIGGWKIGSALAVPNAAEYSHFYIARGVSPWLDGFFPTHPPLEQRIRRINPRWDGRFPEVRREYKKQTGPEQAHWTQNAALTAVTSAELAEAVTQTGAPTVQHIEHARELINRIPEQLAATAHYPEGAWAIALGLMLSGNASDWKTQLGALGLGADHNVLVTLDEILPLLASLREDRRMPLLELCTPALRMLSQEQRAAFKQCLLSVIKADGKVELWEWALYRIFMQALEKPQPARPRYNKPARLAEECRLLLAAVAYTGAGNKQQAESAFFCAASKLGLSTELPDKTNLRQSKLNLALEKIRLLMPLEKPAVLKALCVAAEADGVVNIREVELIRAIADSIDCPMPPLTTH
ncbi:MAG TPA: M48 family metallopeptidase [Gammaproteobacteria bacterium]|nr:M48 family metallopeptidase [Gammaproteobacteria bacterium]